MEEEYDEYELPIIPLVIAAASAIGGIVGVRKFMKNRKAKQEKQARIEAEFELLHRPGEARLNKLLQDDDVDLEEFENEKRFEQQFVDIIAFGYLRTEL